MQAHLCTEEPVLLYITLGTHKLRMTRKLLQQLAGLKLMHWTKTSCHLGAVPGASTTLLDNKTEAIYAPIIYAPITLPKGNISLLLHGGWSMAAPEQVTGTKPTKQKDPLIKMCLFDFCYNQHFFLTHAYKVTCWNMNLCYCSYNVLF